MLVRVALLARVPQPSRGTTARLLVAVMAAQADDSITSFFQKVLGNYGYGDSMDVDSDDSDDEGPESETAKSTATTDGLLAKGASQDISKSFRFGLKPFRIVSRTRFIPHPSLLMGSHP